MPGTAITALKELEISYSPWSNLRVARKLFSDVRLKSGKTLLEEIVRLREEAREQGVFFVSLGFDRDQNFFAGGYVPLTDEKLIEMLFDFISWVGRKEASEEKVERPAPSDAKYS